MTEQPKKFSFTKTALEKLQPSDKQVSYQDTTLPGLILLVYPTGGKSFFLYRRIAGRPERIKLGTFPQMTVEQARRDAAKANGAIADKQNPAAVRRAVKAEATFGETFQHFIRRKRNRSGKPLSTRTVEDYTAMLDTHLAGLVNLKLSQVTPDRLRSLKIVSDTQNNRARAVISSVFNWATEEGLTAVANPAKAIRSRFIASRERFLQPAELPAFLAAVEASRLRDFFMLALLTGARRSNVQAMRWQDLDLTEAVWTLPADTTKNGASHAVALPPEAVEILEQRKRERVVNAVWVFPGSGKTGHLVTPRKAWLEVLEAAGLDEDLRIHDLRRTLGSWQARAGASLQVIGKSLGHKSQQATAIYSRLDLDPVRTSVEGAVRDLIAAGKQPTGAKVVPLRRGQRG
jgi:integrase